MIVRALRIRSAGERRDLSNINRNWRSFDTSFIRRRSILLCLKRTATSCKESWNPRKQTSVSELYFCPMQIEDGILRIVTGLFERVAIMAHLRCLWCRSMLECSGHMMKLVAVDLTRDSCQGSGVVLPGILKHFEGVLLVFLKFLQGVSWAGIRGGPLNKKPGNQRASYAFNDLASSRLRTWWTSSGLLSAQSIPCVCCSRMYGSPGGNGAAAEGVVR